MTRSSEVVMRLNGCDATDGMFDLVFSRPQGDQPTPNRYQCICCTVHAKLEQKPEEGVIAQTDQVRHACMSE